MIHISYLTLAWSNLEGVFRLNSSINDSWNSELFTTVTFPLRVVHSNLWSLYARFVGNSTCLGSGKLQTVSLFRYTSVILVNFQTDESQLTTFPFDNFLKCNVRKKSSKLNQKYYDILACRPKFHIISREGPVPNIKICDKSSWHGAISLEPRKASHQYHLF